MTGPPPIAATVLGSLEPAPGMRRVVLGGPGLDAFATGPGVLGPYLKLHLADPDGTSRIRTYSVRRYDPDRRELWIDIVLHGGASPGGAFAERARAGGTVRLGGPGWMPAEPCDRYLLAGDETALPAIAHILENLPAGAAAEAFVEVSDPALRGLLADRRVRWLERPPGTASRLSDAALASGLARRAEGLLIWAGAEAEIARALRRHGRGTLGLPPARCQVLAYWRRGQAEGAFSYVA